MRLAAAAAALVLAGCDGAEELPADAGQKFDPIAFFEGRTSGEGTLNKLVGGGTGIQVRSLGRRDGRGGLVLDQLIKSGDKAPTRRRWVMRPVAPGRFTGTLTDAQGPVTGTLSGPRATIRYRDRNGFDVEQHLALQSDGRTLLNELSVRRAGVRVARLEETIRKVD